MTTITPLSGPEYDSLVAWRTSRVLSPADPEFVTHLIFALSQRKDGDERPAHFVRVVRLGVLGTEIFPSALDGVTAQRDMLGALRFRGLPFIALLARLPGQALLFACGVEGVATTQEAAVALADDAWDALTTQMLGSHNRFILPISVAQLDALDAANAAWDQVSMVRGHPDPSTAHQLETFISSSDEEFVITLVAQPLNFATMTLARYIAKLDAEFGVLGLDFEEQLRRADEGLEHGALLYQMFVLARTPESMAGVSEKLIDAFWTSNAPHMLSVVRPSGASETARLRAHAAVFTSDLRPGLDPRSIERFEFSSYITLNELAALIHPVS